MPILILFLVFLYLVPAILAEVRKKRNAGGIVALNILGGWTVIGWIIAFVWALCEDAPVVASPVTAAELQVQK